MLHRFLLPLLLGFSFSLTAAPLAPTTSAPLYLHLYEINEQWWTETSPVDYLTEVAFADDNARIGKHLELVEGLLRKRSVEHLSAEQRARRAHVLDRLHDYWQSGRFPRNDYRPARIPVFVDAENTACAVGYLLRATGEQALVDRIAREDNFADLQDLLRYAEVPAWAAEHGFTTEELAWIQPGYAVAYFDAYPFGNDLGIAGGRVLDLRVYADELYFAGDFTAIDDHVAAKLTAWNGTSFRDFPGLEGTSGRIEQLSFDDASGDLYLIGRLDDFPGATETVLFARYRDNAWESLLTEAQTDVGDTFTKLMCAQGLCLLSGDFTQIHANTDIQALAIFDLAVDGWEVFNPELRFTGIIRDFDWSGDSLLIGGNLLLSTAADTLAHGIALLDLATRSVPAGGNAPTHEYMIQDYHHVDFDNSDWGAGYFAVGQSSNGNYLVQVGYAELVGYAEEVNLDTPPLWSGYYDDRNLLTGGWDFTHLDEDEYIVLTTIPGESTLTYSPLITANAPVTALTEFRNELFIAGDFTEIDGTAINELARANLLISDTEAAPSSPPVTVATDGMRLLLLNAPALLPSDSRLELFDAGGRLVLTRELSGRAGADPLLVAGLPAGAYTYRLRLDDEHAVGQVALVR